MDCHYHPGTVSTSTCTVCGKPMCEDCTLEIAGKTYCKDCLEKIVGVSENNVAETTAPSNNPISDTLQDMDTTYDPNEYAYYESDYQSPSNNNIPSRKDIIGDTLNKENTQSPNFNNSPYALNNFNDQEYGYNSPSNQNPYGDNNQTPLYDEQTRNSPQYSTVDSAAQSNDNYYSPQTQQNDYDDGFIYPDHSYEPPEIPGRSTSKYDSYLDDLYFDEPDLPLNEQLAKDEEYYGSLTQKPYIPNERVDVREQEQYYDAPINEYEPYIPTGNGQNEGFLNINNVGYNNPQGDYIQRPPQDFRHGQSPRQRAPIDDPGIRPSNRSIHNIRPDITTEKEPYGAVDILLTIILIVLIILVIFYVVYLFLLNAYYPTFADALFGLAEPQTFFGHLLGK